MALPVRKFVVIDSHSVTENHEHAVVVGETRGPPHQPTASLLAQSRGAIALCMFRRANQALQRNGHSIRFVLARPSSSSR